ncbi:hypothetical protein ACFFIX_19805 [Metabacillus herbersteinensis]|uniref:Uncharacterized protein n=1 Tax=Metabacillus herbersteinensis TaxID=283816 RepID=A0ABV6GJE8_9BACI
MLIFLVKLIIQFIEEVKLVGKSAMAQLTLHDFGAIVFLSYLAFAPIKGKAYPSVNIKTKFDK